MNGPARSTPTRCRLLGNSVAFVADNIPPDLIVGICGHRALTASRVLLKPGRHDVMSCGASFPAVHYDEEVTRVAADHSWETPSEPPAAAF
jgi:hypothetical protein